MNTLQIYAVAEDVPVQNVYWAIGTPSVTKACAMQEIGMTIAKSGKVTVHTPEEKAIDTLEKFIENPDHAALNNEFVESLKLAVEKLKEVKK